MLVGWVILSYTKLSGVSLVAMEMLLAFVVIYFFSTKRYDSLERRWGHTVPKKNLCQFNLAQLVLFKESYWPLTTCKCGPVGIGQGGDCCPWLIMEWSVPVSRMPLKGSCPCVRSTQDIHLLIATLSIKLGIYSHLSKSRCSS